MGKISSGLISIRVSDPWIMRRASWSTRAHHAFPFRIITYSALSRGTCGRRCRVAFPWRKGFDIFQRCRILDPLQSLRNGYNPNIAHRCKLFEEGHRSCHEQTYQKRAINKYRFTFSIKKLLEVKFRPKMYSYYSGIHIFRTFKRNK